MYSILRDIRQENNYTQESAAKLLGISQANYSKMERQEMPFDVQQMIKLAKHFDISLDYLVGISNTRRHFGE